MKKKFKNIIRKELGLGECKISLKQTFEELGADSLDFISVIMRLEKEFNISIDETLLSDLYEFENITLKKVYKIIK